MHIIRNCSPHHSRQDTDNIKVLSDSHKVIRFETTEL